MHEATGPVPPVTRASAIPQHVERAEPEPHYEPELEYERAQPEPQFEPAAASAAPSATDTGQSGLSAHFAAPPTQPVIRPRATDHELPEQLSLAEKLGLRAPGGDDDLGEQNVGPTK